MNIELNKRELIWLTLIIVGISVPVFIIIGMILFVYPNNDSLISFIIKYRFLLGLF